MLIALTTVKAASARGWSSLESWGRYSLGDIRTAFENAVAEAKLDGLHFHDLRHSFASWFVIQGGSIQPCRRSWAIRTSS